MAAIQETVVSVTVQADQDVFHHYTGGIINSHECGTNLDHAIAAVGYGTDEKSGQTYYIIRNSWTESWGEHGYVRIAASGENSKGYCGIQMDNLWPVTD
jgi:cathepsin L